LFKSRGYVLLYININVYIACSDNHKSKYCGSPEHFVNMIKKKKNADSGQQLL